MANKTITQIYTDNPASTPLTGNELLEAVQSGNSVGLTAQDIADLGSAPIVPDTRIPFGNGVDAYTSSADFVYDVANTLFSVKFGGNEYLKNDVANGLHGIGDLGNISTSTKVLLDIMNDAAYLSGLTAYFGDGLDQYATVKLIISQSSELLTYQKGSNKYLSLDIVNSIFEFGDLDNINRTGKIIIDDATDVTTIQQRGLTYIGDWEDRNNSTRLIIDDPNKILTYQKASDAYLSIDVTTDVYKIGNPNTTWAEWNGPNKTIEEYYGIYPMLLLDWFNYIFKIGDVDAGSLGNVFVVDDFGSLSYYDNILHDGKFGINITIPSVALDVLGDEKVSGNIDAATYSVGATPGATDDVVIVGLTNTYTLSFISGIYTGTVIT